MADTPQTPQLPPDLPVVPLRGAVVLPMTVAPLGVSRPMSVEAINRALAGDRMVLLLLQKSDSRRARRRTTCTASAPWRSSGRWPRAPSGMRVLVEGVARARAEFLQTDGGVLQALIKPLPESSERSIEIDAHVRRLQELVDRALSLATGLSPDIKTLVSQPRRSAAHRLPARQPARHEGRRTSSSCSRRTASRSSSTPCRWRWRARSRSSS